MSPAAAASPSKLAPMTERLVRPDWVRRINLMAGSVGGHARDLVPIDAADLLDTATAGLGGLPAGDLGDPRWQERFEALATAIDATDMHLVGRLITKQELLRSLRARLLLTAAIDAAPEITDRPVTAPVIVTGPARSGTTILFELLALDPGLRPPTAAEALHPVPPPEAAGNPDFPEPIVLSECEQEFWADVQPEFQALHELRSDLPVECVTLTQGSFCGFHWSMIASLDSWLPDPAVNYAYERQFLQALQHGDEQWVLKTPGHLMLLPLLYAEFSDAWVVQTHRDPAKTMPSTVSTTAMIQWLRTDHVDVDGMAEVILAVFAAGLNGSIDVRASGHRARGTVRGRALRPADERPGGHPASRLRPDGPRLHRRPRRRRARLPGPQAQGQVRRPPLPARGLGLHRRVAARRPSPLHRPLRRGQRVTVPYGPRPPVSRVGFAHLVPKTNPRIRHGGPARFLGAILRIYHPKPTREIQGSPGQ